MLYRLLTDYTEIIALLAKFNYRYYVARVKEWNEKLNLPTTPVEEWDRQCLEQKQEWFDNFPSDTRYEVCCLDGDAWDRPTWRGVFAKLSDAVSFAKSGHDFVFFAKFIARTH